MKDRLIFRIAALILEGYREGEAPSEDIMTIIKGYSKGWSTLDYAPLPVEIIFSLGPVKISFANGNFALVMENTAHELTNDEARIIIDAYDNGNGESK
jgi:hypothetical protein